MDLTGLKMTQGKEIFSSDHHPYTLGGETYVRINVRTSCANTEACIDISILVFLVVILSSAIVCLIGVNKILGWLCCCLSSPKPPPQQTMDVADVEEEEKGEDADPDSVVVHSTELPDYEEALNMPRPETRIDGSEGTAPGMLRMAGPGHPAAAAARPLPAVDRRNIVIRQPGMHPLTIPLQTLQGLKPNQGLHTGQAGHLLVKTENGQYKIIKVAVGSTRPVQQSPQI